MLKIPIKIFGQPQPACGLPIPEAVLVRTLTATHIRVWFWYLLCSCLFGCALERTAPTGTLVIGIPPFGTFQDITLSPGQPISINFPIERVRAFVVYSGTLRLAFQNGGILVLRGFTGDADGNGLSREIWFQNGQQKTAADFIRRLEVQMARPPRRSVELPPVEPLPPVERAPFEGEAARPFPPPPPEEPSIPPVQHEYAPLPPGGWHALPPRTTRPPLEEPRRQETMPEREESWLRQTMIMRTLINPDEREASGFALYSYLLFSRDEPEGENWERRRAAIRGYVTEVDPLSEQRRLLVENSDINGFYVPIHAKPPLSLDILNDKSGLIDYIMKEYDFARARWIIHYLGLRGDGPFLVAMLRPVDDPAGVERNRMLVYNLSAVPSELIKLWIVEFKAATSREEFWNHDLRYLALQIRTAITIIAESLHATREALASIITEPSR